MLEFDLLMLAHSKSPSASNDVLPSALVSPADFEQPACELLRAIRGRRSQLAFARRIGYRGNPSTHWERGVRHPTTAEALRAANSVGLDVVGAFKRFVPLPAPASGDAVSLARWLNQLRGAMTIQSLAARLGCSRHTAGRWLSGQAQPRLHEFMALVEVCTGRVHDWVAELVDIRSVPSLEPAFNRGLAARTLASDQPWSEAVLRVLETTAYRENPESALHALCAALEIPDEELQTALRALRTAGIVECHEGIYHAVRELSVDSGRRSLRQLQRHWLGVARRRMAQETSSDWFAYNVISVSRTDLDRVHECMKRAYVESRAIVAASEPSETTAVVLMQLIKT